MQCERLIGLIKSWYGHVQDETMAPARMVMFIEQHAEECDICLADPELKGEIAKITEMILPESKIPKAVRQAAEQDEAEPETVEEEQKQGGEGEEVYEVDDEV